MTSSHFPPQLAFCHFPVCLLCFFYRKIFSRLKMACIFYPLDVFSCFKISSGKILELFVANSYCFDISSSRGLCDTHLLLLPSITSESGITPVCFLGSLYCSHHILYRTLSQVLTYRHLVTNLNLYEFRSCALYLRCLARCMVDSSE